MILRRVVSALALVGMVACGGGSDEATVDGTGTGSGFSPAAPVAPLPASSLIDIALSHNALVFDPARGAYYASVPGSVVGTGNTIARIDAATGVVTYSRAVGSEPGPMALSSDGGVLYVGLSGSGEVVKLGLPNLEEQWRVRLPATQFDGQLTAAMLSVNPGDSEVVAMSMQSIDGRNHRGVALIRAGVLQPRRTQANTGGHPITFGAGGTFVYGFNNLSTEFGLRRIAVVADGLIEEAVVPSTLGSFQARTIDRVGSSLVVDSQVYAAPGLVLTGQASSASGCRPTGQGNTLLCFGMSTSSPYGDGTIAVVDLSTFATSATPSYRVASDEDNGVSFFELVPGPSGQVAMRHSDFFYATSATSLRLVSNPALR